MVGDLAPKRDQKPWQAMQQKQTEGRGFFRGAGSNQPKPRDGRAQTAQGNWACIVRHAATGRLLGCAFATSRRMS